MTQDKLIDAMKDKIEQKNSDIQELRKHISYLTDKNNQMEAQLEEKQQTLESSKKMLESDIQNMKKSNMDKDSLLADQKTQITLLK